MQLLDTQIQLFDVRLSTTHFQRSVFLLFLFSMYKCTTEFIAHLSHGYSLFLMYTNKQKCIPFCLHKGLPVQTVFFNSYKIVNKAISKYEKRFVVFEHVFNKHIRKCSLIQNNTCNQETT